MLSVPAQIFRVEHGIEIQSLLVNLPAFAKGIHLVHAVDLYDVFDPVKIQRERRHRTVIQDRLLPQDIPRNTLEDIFGFAAFHVFLSPVKGPVTQLAVSVVNNEELYLRIFLRNLCDLIQHQIGNTDNIPPESAPPPAAPPLATYVTQVP